MRILSFFLKNSMIKYSTNISRNVKAILKYLEQSCLQDTCKLPMKEYYLKGSEIE